MNPRGAVTAPRRSGVGRLGFDGPMEVVLGAAHGWAPRLPLCEALGGLLARGASGALRPRGRRRPGRVLAAKAVGADILRRRR
ncbi:hypothetical protein HW130_05425 [Streptomyces sp. PKU-EA00015]|uniref:hypothetical protein n=1 Tax=Streptomyces sp. PKU-EA00015 TaxID=2748326 RepID=UPI0015A1E600|nr:hypothetical protein [Streptomyces sp. PKU-EA00015]NWF25709.1 hypothetical protein [Streptomyces sp. PKU-EA00015]